MGRLKRGASAEATPSLREGDTRRIVSGDPSGCRSLCSRQALREAVRAGRPADVKCLSSEVRDGARLSPSCVASIHGPRMCAVSAGAPGIR